MPSRDEALRQSYDEFPHVEEAFLAALDESLRPRSSAILYDYVDRLQLPASATILDLGCGGGNHSIS
ncbi:MAG TPA: hypothetical protein VNM91_07940, partial [Dehalococcoidia bacterium]|nr:hypothetical protein [Dehalococcoidia bacterium]